MKKNYDVLLVDQDVEALKNVKEALSKNSQGDFRVHQEKSLAEAMLHISQEHTDIILLELTLPDGKGINAVAELYRQAAEIPIIVMNIIENDELARMAVHEGAQDFCSKENFREYHLARMIYFAIERKQTERQLARLASFAWQNPNPIIETDSQGKLIYLNPAVQTLFPDLKERAEEHPFLKDLKDIALVLQNEHKTLEVREIEFNGSFYEQHISYVPESGVIRSYIIDHTERKIAEEKLTSRNRDVERMNRLMVGREIKMRELKETISDLQNRLKAA